MNVRRHRACNKSSSLPLFEFADARSRRSVPLTPGGRYVSRRYPTPPARANLIAELAGIGGEGDDR